MLLLTEASETFRAQPFTLTEERAFITDSGTMLFEEKSDYTVSEPDGSFTYDKDPEKQTEADLSTESATKSELANYAGRRELSVLGNKVSSEFREKGHTSLVGQVTSAHKRFAELADIYRNPSFETFGVFCTKGDTVVGQHNITSLKPTVLKNITPSQEENLPTSIP